LYEEKPALEVGAVDVIKLGNSDGGPSAATLALWRWADLDSDLR